MPDPTVTVLHARGVLDIDTGDVIDGGYVCVEGDRITSVGTDASIAADADEVIELPELTLLPGLMDMEVDLVLGGPGAGLTDPVRDRPGQDDPAGDGQRPANPPRRVHDRAEPRPLRQDRRLPARRGAERGDRRRAGSTAPASSPPDTRSARPAATSTRARRAASRPHMMPLSVEEGIADGVDQVRRAVRYQIKHGAKLIKCCASGGVIASHGPAGAQQYSTEELTAIADEAHRRGLQRRGALPRRRGGERRARRRHRLHRARLHDHRGHDPADGRHRDLPRVDQRARRELGRVEPRQGVPGQGRRRCSRRRSSRCRTRSRPA